MAYLDFELEIGEGSGGRDYQMVARSSAGETRTVMRFPYDELALESQLVKLQVALLRSGGPARRFLSQEEQVVQDFGRALFVALFSAEVRDLYHASRVQAAREGKDGVRVRLCILAPELAMVPWEYLYDPFQQSYLCLSRSTPLVRTVETLLSTQPFAVQPPLRILGMIANPSDLEPLDVEREQKRMRQALQDLEGRGLVQLEWLPGQTWRHLHRAMRGGPWHIFHFIGHGGFHQGEGVLALVNDEGKADLLSATQVGYLLANHASLRLAVLNACDGARGDKRDLFSSTAATLAKRGLPAVLAMQYDITDPAALEYTRTFYEALADQLPVDAALAEARLSMNIGVKNSLEWGTPVLYLRTSNATLFTLPAESRPVPVKASDLPSKQSGLVVPVANAAQRVPPANPESGGVAGVPAQQPDLLSGEQPDAVVAPAPDAQAPPLLQPRATPEAPPVPDPPLTQLPQSNAFAQKEPWVEEGDQHLAARRYQEALAWYEQALAVDTASVRALQGKSLALSYLNHPIEALAVAQTVLHLDPTNAEGYWNQGLILHALGRHEEAATAYDEARQRNPVLGLDRRLPMGTPLRTLKGHTNEVRSVAWSPDGCRLASGGADKTIRLWDAATGQRLTLLTGHTDCVNTAVWSPSGQHLASASHDQTVRLWDGGSDQSCATLTGHTRRVFTVAWSPDERFLASASEDKTVGLWDATNGQYLTPLSGHTEAVYTVAWSPDGQRLASSGLDQRVRLWDTATGRVLTILEGHSNNVVALAWSPDGRHLASASRDRTVRLWETERGQMAFTLTGHPRPMWSVAWSPDGQRLASASDQAVCLWDAASGQLLTTLSAHRAGVHAVAWSPDGDLLASASADNTMRLWWVGEREVS